MFSCIKSLGVTGVGGYEVSVEIYITNGLPAFDVVGLPDAAVKESRERVRAAIKNNGFKFPPKLLTSASSFWPALHMGQAVASWDW